MSPPFSLFLPPPPPPLPHSPATAPLQSPPVPSLFPPPSHFTYHFSQSSTLLLALIAPSAHLLLLRLPLYSVIHLYFSVSASSSPSLPRSPVPPLSVSHSPSSGAAPNRGWRLSLCVRLPSSSFSPSSFSNYHFYHHCTNDTYAASLPVFNHCKHSSTSQPHCCKCTYATCMQMQKLNTGGQLASCHMQTHAHIGIVLLKDI